MFGASGVNSLATCCDAKSQSGLSVKSSQRTKQRRQSAIRNRFVNCPSCGGQRQGSRWQANAQWASRSRGFATPGWRSSPYVQRSQASRPRHPMWHAIALSPGIIEFWPSGQASGKMAANQIKGACVMRRPNINSQGKVFVFSTPSPARASLTVGSTRTKMLRIFAG
jgi:hypothetical protein